MEPGYTKQSLFCSFSQWFLLYEFTSKWHLSRTVTTRRIKKLVRFVSVCTKGEQPATSQQRLQSRGEKIDKVTESKLPQDKLFISFPF